jgi:hypothetical protein
LGKFVETDVYWQSWVNSPLAEIPARLWFGKFRVVVDLMFYVIVILSIKSPRRIDQRINYSVKADERWHGPVPDFMSTLK